MYPAQKVSGLIVWLSLTGAALVLASGTPSLAREVRIPELETIREDDSSLLKGRVQGSDLNALGQIVEMDHVVVMAAIGSQPGAVYPLPPGGMYLCPLPEGARSPYCIGDTTLTPEEVRGKNIVTVRLAAFHLREVPVWRAYGGVPGWVDNAPQQSRGTSKAGYRWNMRGSHIGSGLCWTTATVDLVPGGRPARCTITRPPQGCWAEMR